MAVFGGLNGWLQAIKKHAGAPYTVPGGYNFGSAPGASAQLSAETATSPGVEAVAGPQVQQQSSYQQTVSPGLLNSPQQQQAATGYTPTSQRGRAMNFGR